MLNTEDFKIYGRVNFRGSRCAYMNPVVSTQQRTVQPASPFIKSLRNVPVLGNVQMHSYRNFNLSAGNARIHQVGRLNLLCGKRSISRFEGRQSFLPVSRH